MAELTPIPGPPPLPFIGNARDIDPNNYSASICRLADIYGPIFQINLGGTDRIYVSSVALTRELINEPRFVKAVSVSQKELRPLAGNGLFTADVGNHEWEIAHRVLVPSFGPMQIRGMFDDLFDIASQLILKWARHPGQKILVSDDFTRLALDSIAYCTMGIRFNSFYTEDMHPFVKAMVVALGESVKKSSRTSFANYILRDSQYKIEEATKVMKGVARQVLDERRASSSDRKDVLYHMLNSKDPVTHEKMTDEAVMNNMITFLIAGHETTSGLLSFLMNYLISNPETMAKAREEVDRVVGEGPLTVEHLSNLPYITACLRETLRLQPTATQFNVQVNPKSPNEYEVIGGKYMIPKGIYVGLSLHGVHRDPAVYGEDAEEFKPERMYGENFDKLPNGAWKPFGNGSRGCIGRPFAWQEALLITALILQNFDLRFADPNYKLVVKQTLTIKPKDCYIYAELREGLDPAKLTKRLFQGKSDAEGKTTTVPDAAKLGASPSGPKKPMSIFYGSNSGTCESLANALSRAAATHGFNASIESLDQATGKLPTDRPVIVVTCSYEGQPPDNAAQFVNWISKLETDKSTLSGVSYAVFGCGNKEWAQTYQRIPKLVDESLAKNGAKQVAESGFVDVSGPHDPYTVFDAWMDEQLWPKLGTSASADAMAGILDIDIDTSLRPKHLRQNIYDAVVLSNEVRTHNNDKEKRHLRLRLPSGLDYKAGDYLSVLPLNHSDNIRRVLNFFQLPWDTMITVHPGIATSLPVEHPISLWDALAAYFELSQPVSKKNAGKIAEMVHDESQKDKAYAWANADFDVEITQKRRSLIDLLEAFPSADISLAEFLTMLPPMRVREYSISSSPLVDPTVASLTFTVLDEPSKASPTTRFRGVASNYLAQLRPYDMVHITVKKSLKFYLPPDPEATAVILVCAGTGISPMHGFLEERAAQKAAGRALAPAYLFYGVMTPEKDGLFAEELAQWEKDGVVQVFWACSRDKESSKGCAYVQERLWAEREIVAKAFGEQNGKIYVCGANVVGQGVAEVAKKVYREYCDSKGIQKSDAEIDAWFDGIKNERFVSDVFA